MFDTVRYQYNIYYDDHAVGEDEIKSAGDICRRCSTSIRKCKIYEMYPTIECLTQPSFAGPRWGHVRLAL